MTLAYVGLGSNLEQPRQQLQRALLELDAVPGTRVVKTSSFYRTAPMGYADQPEFVNAVAQLETTLGAADLLRELQAIEARHGRSRSFANAPRTLDLDLLLFGETILSGGNLALPHPRMHERAFVLEPLLEIAPQAVIPGRGTARALFEGCRDQRVERIG